MKKTRLKATLIAPLILLVPVLILLFFIGYSGLDNSNGKDAALSGIFLFFLPFVIILVYFIHIAILSLINIFKNPTLKKFILIIFIANIILSISFGILTSINDREFLIGDIIGLFFIGLITLGPSALVFYIMYLRKYLKKIQRRPANQNST